MKVGEDFILVKVTVFAQAEEFSAELLRSNHKRQLIQQTQVIQYKNSLSTLKMVFTCVHW